MQVVEKNQNLFERAKKVIPGGVNSPVRSFSSVGGVPYSSAMPRALMFGMKKVIDTSIMFSLMDQ